MLDDFGFIITRHVSSDIHYQYWIECYNCIRKYYTQHIMIIDDNSDENILNKNKVDANFYNVHFIKSEFLKRGEMLPYYYFYKLKPFKKAIILNDSMFIQKPFTDMILQVKDIKYLWHFDEPTHPIDIISFVKYNDEMLNTKNYKGCFATTCIITWDFLEKLQWNYNFLNLIHYVNSRVLRQQLERVFAILCITLLKKENIYNPENISIFGSIFQVPYAFQLNYYNYKNGIGTDQYIVKVWTSR